MADKPKAEDWLTIVGVVRDVRQQSLTEAPSVSIYLPYGQIAQPFFLSHMSFLVRTEGDPTALTTAVRCRRPKARSGIADAIHRHHGSDDERRR